MRRRGRRKRILSDSSEGSEKYYEMLPTGATPDIENGHVYKIQNRTVTPELTSILLLKERGKNRSAM
jgi:hypothetical protein